MAEWADRLFIWSVLALVPLVLIGVPIFFLTGRYKRIGLRPLMRCLEGIELQDERGPGDVYLVYHTYRGFLLWTIQEEHCIIASRADAEKLLGRLLRFNLTWGMLSYGMLFIPFLAVGNYYAQRSSIRQQSQSAMNSTAL